MMLHAIHFDKSRAGYKESTARIALVFCCLAIGLVFILVACTTYGSVIQVIATGCLKNTGSERWTLHDTQFYRNQI